MSPRHILTLADRKRGCAVARGRAGGRKAQASGKAHKLTREERRRGGLATAAKRRKERERALVTLALPGPSRLIRPETFTEPPAKYRDQMLAQRVEAPIAEAYARLEKAIAAVDFGPAKRGSESPSGEGITSDDVRAYRETQGVEEDAYVAAEWDATKRDLALGASLAGKLMDAQAPEFPIPPVRTLVRIREADEFPAWRGEHRVVGYEEPYVLLANPEGPLRVSGGPGKFRPGSLEIVTETPRPLACDPFTLSALKRFLPGPRSPLSLTRSQRAHVDIMREAGYLTVTGDSMLALTEKGRQAIEGSETSDV